MPLQYSRLLHFAICVPTQIFAQELAQYCYTYIFLATVTDRQLECIRCTTALCLYVAFYLFIRLFTINKLKTFLTVVILSLEDYGNTIHLKVLRAGSEPTDAPYRAIIVHWEYSFFLRHVPMALAVPLNNGEETHRDGTRITKTVQIPCKTCEITNAHWASMKDYALNLPLRTLVQQIDV